MEAKKGFVVAGFPQKGGRGGSEVTEVDVAWVGLVDCVWSLLMERQTFLPRSLISKYYYVRMDHSLNALHAASISC